MSFWIISIKISYMEYWHFKMLNLTSNHMNVHLSGASLTFYKLSYLISTWWKYQFLYFRVTNLCKREEFLYTLTWWKVWNLMCRTLSRRGCKYKERAMSTIPPNTMVRGTQPEPSINMKVTKASQRASPHVCSGLLPPQQLCSPLMTSWWNGWHMDFPHRSEIVCRSI